MRPRGSGTLQEREPDEVEQWGRFPDCRTALTLRPGRLSIRDLYSPDQVTGVGIWSMKLVPRFFWLVTSWNCFVRWDLAAATLSA